MARIAYNTLEKENPSVLAKANSLLKIYSSAHPSDTHKESQYPFVECATFADDIKSKGGTWQSDWHFVNNPYLDMGGKPEDYKNYGASTHNITYIMPAILDWIQGKNNY